MSLYSVVPDDVDVISMKKILFFVSSMQGGGAERVAALLCNHWARKGHEVLVVPTFSGRGGCFYPLDESVRLEYLADRVGTTRKTPWTMARRLLAMRAMVQEFQPDVVVSFFPHVNVAALLATRGLGVPVVVSERIYPPLMAIGPIWPILRRWVYPWASMVVMQTQRGLAWLQQESPTSRGYVVPNPCLYPLPEGEPRVEPGSVVCEDRRILLGVGRLVAQKDFSQLINAFASLSERFPEWDLVILGEGQERVSLKKQVAAQGLVGRVHLPGRVGNLGAWYSRADLYAMSSRFEGFPNTLMEAMAHGVPAVSFDCNTGPADLIEDGVNGYLVPPPAGSVGLADKLAELMADDVTRDAMGKRAAIVRERYSIEQVAVQWERVLEWMV